MQLGLPGSDARELAQVAALHLLRSGQRQRVDEGDIARRLEVREPLERMRDDARRDAARAAAVFGAFVSTMQASTSSPRTGSGVAATPTAATARVLGDDALDLDRRDVLAAAADHVLAPVDEVEVAVGAAPDDVAGVEPAAGPGLVGRRARP